ncbi:MAG: HlyD family efflux transporter periplasmic adaptor subunit [Planctomycetaceae bacterium]|nr:HlyD family efflux transporter periplasmic adaptor subunit [Planctomycetaceae bacterium]
MTDHWTRLSGETARSAERRVKQPFVVLSAGLTLIVCCATTFPIPPRTSPRSVTSANILTVPVKRGPLHATLKEEGRVDSADNFVVASECDRATTIINLIPEGEWVLKGDVVVELDSSDLVEKLKQREILTINAKAALIQAQEVVELQKLENASALAAARLAERLADLDLKKFIEGDFPKQKKEAEGAVALAEEDVTRARERYEYVTRMAKKGYLSPTDVEQQRLAVLKYEEAFEKARLELEVLVEYTYHRDLAELESLTAETKRELARTQKTAELALANREILVKQRESQLRNHEDFAERMRNNIAACTIRSPVTGEIIYANEGSIRNEILEGETVRFRQEVVRVPNLEELEVNVRIHESRMAGVSTGLKATITLDAFPQLLLNGEVVTVANVPTPGTGYNSDLRGYDVTIRIDGTSEQLKNLKPGLNAKVEIQIDERPDCLHIPPTSVVDISGRRVVFIETPSGIEHREIELGMLSDTGVEVLSGLEENEQVLLGPRTNCSDQILALREESGSEVNVENIGG